MAVSMHRDSKSGIWILQWGGRKGRRFHWTGKRDRTAAMIILKQKERELALQETGPLISRIVDTVMAALEKRIEHVIHTKLHAAPKASPEKAPDRSVDR